MRADGRPKVLFHRGAGNVQRLVQARTSMLISRRGGRRVGCDERRCGSATGRAARAEALLRLSGAAERQPLGLRARCRWPREIGRASCRERVEMSAVARAVKKIEQQERGSHERPRWSNYETIW